jgi:hypothetical protein
MRFLGATPSNVADIITKALLDLKANIASPTFTGTVTAPRLVLPPVTLTDAATIATDASLGNHFRVSMGGNRTLGVPTNPTDGQRCLWEVTASGANRTLTLSTSTGGFIFGTDITALTATTSAKADFIGAIYNSTANRWRVVSYIKGF